MVAPLLPHSGDCPSHILNFPAQISSPLQDFCNHLGIYKQRDVTFQVNEQHLGSPYFWKEPGMSAVLKKSGVAENKVREF